jgi:hypothetical protein
MSPPGVAEWITAICTAVIALGTLVTAAGVVFLWQQARLLKAQLVSAHADQVRLRRQTAIGYLFEWSRGLQQGWSLARRLAEKLDDVQSQALADEKPLTLSNQLKPLVIGVLPEIPDTVRNATADIALGEREVSAIRWQLIRYLNSLEILFTAARHDIADHDILLEQFDYLVSPKEGRYFLEKFREAVGRDGYPSVDWAQTKLMAKLRALRTQGEQRSQLPGDRAPARLDGER